MKLILDSLRNILLFFTAFFIVTTIVCTAAMAEAVFFKDGAIIEGSILNENAKALNFKMIDGTKKEIPRKDILRIAYHDGYKEKRHLSMMDGKEMDVYVVDEDKTSYTFRLTLNSAAETRVSKDDVDGISKRKVSNVLKFRDNGDGTITDLRTGLVWSKNANIARKSINWSDSASYCKSLSAADYDDWYLPSKAQMMTLIDGLPKNQDWAPLFSGQGFIDMQDTYWTSDESSRFDGFCLSFGKKSIVTFNKTTPNIFILPVRGTGYQKRNSITEKKLKKDITNYIQSVPATDSKEYKAELKKLIDAM
jgi:hypothetical protein